MPKSIQRGLRAAAIGVLALALAVQGAAAATMAVGSAPAPAGPARGTAPPDSHCMADMADMGDMGGMGDMGERSHPDSGKSPPGVCASCLASCCAMTALPTAFQLTLIGRAADTFAPSPPSRPAVFLTSGPERPPRPARA
jgi:type IV secretory pathway TrbL component